jgi:hypothetical protein
LPTSHRRRPSWPTDRPTSPPKQAPPSPSPRMSRV